MTDKPTNRVCTECLNNHDTADYCPRCGNGEWDEQYQYDFERDVDLPFVFDYEVYDDNYQLWRTFCRAAFDQHELRGKQIANKPGTLPPMKYNVFKVWFKLTKNLELKGPFLDEQEAREA